MADADNCKEPWETHATQKTDTTEKPIPTKEQIIKQQKIERTPSNTFPVVIYWIGTLVLVLIWYMFSRHKSFDGESLVWIAGGATFIYMTGGHINSFIKNKTLPSGIGVIEDINRYKGFVFCWMILATISLGMYLLFEYETIPKNEIMIIAGTISLEYIAGNRSNKIATTL